MGRSPEEILAEARQVMDEPDSQARDYLRLHRELHTVLDDIDAFWLRWRYVGECRGWLEAIGKRGSWWGSQMRVQE